jgi:hypothetical protein
MKNFSKILLTAALIAVAFNANAQLGIKAGFVSSTATSKFEEGNVSAEVKTDPISGFKIGVDYNFAFGNSGLSFRPGVNYTYFGGATDKDDDDFKSYFHFANVPLELKYTFSINDDFGIYALVGPKMVFGISAVEKFDEDGMSEKYNMYTGKWESTINGETSSGEEEDGGPMKRLDMQLGAGIGVQYKALSLEFGYDWGMLNTLKTGDDWGDITMKRNQLGITLGYSF